MASFTDEGVSLVDIFYDDFSTVGTDINGLRVITSSITDGGSIRKDRPTIRALIVRLCIHQDRNSGITEVSRFVVT